MFRFRVLPLVAALLLSGCGLAPQADVPHVTSMPKLRAADFTGTYLAVNFGPSPDMEAAAENLRVQLGFVDLSHAVPPRDPREYHVTVGYFQNLTDHDAETLAERFRGHDLDVAITGYGVANQQAAYFTVDGIDDARAVLAGTNLRFTADDPHVTFGVNPANPRDVHGVPKQAQQNIGPYRIHAEFHLMQGAKKLW